jgi:peptide-methionine (R)-S-oxide reductase
VKEEHKQKLSPEQYRILVEKGTERPFTGKFLENKEKGKYNCAACGTPLFSSDTKYDSGSGWPSFYDVVDKGNVELIRDTSLGMIRVEVVCANCGGHLGHVFEDGPGDKTGMRYCINSASLDFDKENS